jgi:hypothetical protein
LLTLFRGRGDLVQNEQPGLFSEATRRYALSVLVVVYTFNFIDRQILSILLEPIKLDLGLSDTQLDLLPTFTARAGLLPTPGISRRGSARIRARLP